MTRRSPSAVFLSIIFLVSSVATAQEQGRRSRAAITPGLSLVAAKRLEGAREFVALGQWKEALDALEDLSTDFGDALVEVEPGRFLNVHDVCLAAIARMPADGLAVYRARVDGTAEFLYREAMQWNDSQMMRQLLRKYHPSSFGDDALWWLAEDAWTRGDLDQARLCWTQLVPISQSMSADYPSVLRFPDTSYSHPLILGRLILCSIMQRDLVAAASELRAFCRLYPDAEGTLAGRNGILCQTLQQVLLEAEEWPADDTAGECPTFSCRTSRNAVARVPPSGLQPLWRTSLKESTLPLAGGVRRPPLSHAAPGVFPVVWNGLALIHDESGVRALNLDDGMPAWPTDRAGDTGLILQNSHSNPVPIPSIGIPRFTGMVAGGRYYTRIGPPIVATAAGSLRRIEDRLVALDLKTGEGRLEWETTAPELLDQENWRFTGAPLAVDGHLYVTMRRTGIQVELTVACLHADTGELIWRQPVAIDLEPPPAAWHRIDHELLCCGAGSIYYATHSGVVISLDAGSGSINWVVSYPSFALSTAESSHQLSAGLLPPVFHRGILYVAPRDAAHMMALDASTGVLRWQTAKPGRINALIGVSENVLVATGEKLWRIAADSGYIYSPFGYEDPSGFGFGHGAIAGRSVFWTTREDLFEVDIPSGQALRRLPLSLLGQAAGGNLVIADGYLLLAAPGQLTVFSSR